MSWLCVLFACGDVAPELSVHCKVALAPATGPLTAEAAAAPDLVALAEVRIREARLTGDDGFYTLANSVAACAHERFPIDQDVARLMAFLLLQFHRFEEAEAAALALTVADPDDREAWLLLGDARLEQGEFDEAAAAFRRMARGADPVLFDRLATLAFAKGDLARAVAAERQAVGLAQKAPAADLSFYLATLGWYGVLSGGDGPEFDTALALVPTEPRALLWRGRTRLHRGDRVGAAEDFRAVGPTVEALWALSEIDPSRSPREVSRQDPRAYGMWLAGTEPEEAKRLLERDLASRQDPLTKMAWLWARFRCGETVAEEAREVLDAGSGEPRVSLWGGLILLDNAALQRAVAMGPGLLPSELSLAEQTIASMAVSTQKEVGNLPRP